MKIFIPLCLIALTIISCRSYSQFYFGTGAGASIINKKVFNGPSQYSLDGEDFAYRFFAGFDSWFLGLEGGYHNLGKINQQQGTAMLQTKINGWDLAARGRLKLRRVTAFGKAGIFFSKAQNIAGSAQYDETSNSFLWGLGAEFNPRRFGLRLEFESLDLRETSKVFMISAAGTYELRFGKK